MTNFQHPFVITALVAVIHHPLTREEMDYPNMSGNNGKKDKL